jgi:hypothetical protein
MDPMNMKILVGTVLTAAIGFVPAISSAQHHAGASSSAQAQGRSPSQGTPSGTAAPRGNDQPAPQSTPPPDSGRQGDSSSSGATSRDGDGNGVVGRAVPHTGPPPRRGGGGTVIVPGSVGFFPWGFDYPYYGGYYGAYDPWYGWYPGVAPGAYSSSGPEGSLRLKVKPREAAVYVDGYYVGVVDDFDGVFQRLHLDPGPHHVEIQSPGYDPLTFDVRIDPDHTTTYTGALTAIR